MFIYQSLFYYLSEYRLYLSDTGASMETNKKKGRFLLYNIKKGAL